MSVGRAVAWQDIRDFRNILVRQDFGVDLAIVWDVSEGDLPVLIEQAEVLRQTVQS